MGNPTQPFEQRTPVADAVSLDAHQLHMGAGVDQAVLQVAPHAVVMASAMTSAATPAATPVMEMVVTTPTTACRRFAFRYRAATYSSNRIEPTLQAHRTPFFATPTLSCRS